jgi:AraC-like DNA-binding protein
MPAQAISLDEFDTAPRPVAALSRTFPPGSATPHHRHRRGQLIHAVAGIMRIDTDEATWLVPPARALWVPPGVAHTVSMRGQVEMRTIYIEATLAHRLPAAPMLIEVGALLRELILALLQEPAAYDAQGRGGQLAALILTELAAMRAWSKELRLPRDARARRIAQALLADPAIDDGLDRWAERAGASPRTLARLFRTETGLSFAEWRAQVRAVEGLAQLAVGSTVGTAARAVGYASASAFSAMVRRTFGRAPREL